MSPLRPFLLPQLRVYFRNRRLVPSSAPRNVNISTILSTLRILPVATGVYPNPFRLPIPEPSPIPFRINTCKSVSKQTTSTPFRIIHLCKTRRREGLLLTSHVQFSVSCVLPSQCPPCPCLPRPGRGGKSHVLSSLPPLGRSLRSFSHSLPLFSIACRLFSQNAGGWGTPRRPSSGRHSGAKSVGTRLGMRALQKQRQRQDAAFGLGALKRRPYNSGISGTDGNRSLSIF